MASGASSDRSLRPTDSCTGLPGAWFDSQISKNLTRSTRSTTLPHARFGSRFPGIILLPKACIIRDPVQFGLEGVAGRPVKNGPLTKDYRLAPPGSRGSMVRNDHHSV
jgi:hypothetical protein